MKKVAADVTLGQDVRIADFVNLYGCRIGDESRIGPFVALARTITYYRADIEATLLHGVNNGRVESLNTKVRLIARRAFGFRSAQALIGPHQAEQVRSPSFTPGRGRCHRASSDPHVRG